MAALDRRQLVTGRDRDDQIVISYGPDLVDQQRRASGYVSRIALPRVRLLHLRTTGYGTKRT